MQEGLETYLLPCASAVGLAGSINGVLVFAQVHQSRGQAGKVADVVEKDLGSLVQLCIVAAVTDLDSSSM